MIWFKNLFDIWKKTIQSEKGPEFVWTFHKGDILKKEICKSIFTLISHQKNSKWYHDKIPLYIYKNNCNKYSLIVTKDGKDAEPLSLQYWPWELNSYSRKKWHFLCIIKYTFTKFQKNDGLDLHKNLPINVHWSFIYKIPKPESNQMSFKGWMNKTKVDCAYNNYYSARNKNELLAITMC